MIPTSQPPTTNFPPELELIAERLYENETLDCIKQRYQSKEDFMKVFRKALKEAFDLGIIEEHNASKYGVKNENGEWEDFINGGLFK